MTHSQRVLAASITWTLIAVAVFFAVGTMSFLAVALLAVGGFVPPLVYVALSGDPTPTIAQVLHDTEEGRPGT